MSLIFGFILGTILGSGIKVLADRSLTNKSFGGRSYCPNCKKKLRWYDLFPVLSYIFLKGKCRYCHEKISVEYLLVEVAMGILMAFLFWQQSSKFQFLILNFKSISNVQNFQFLIFFFELILKTFFIAVLAVLFLTDFKKMFIPDRIVLPAIVIGIILSLAIVLTKIAYLYFYLLQTDLGRLLLPPKNEYFQRHVWQITEPFLWSLLTGAVIAGFFFSLIIVTRGKGMGGGDVKLGAFIGIMLGFPAALFALVFSFLAGAIFSLGLIILRKKHFGQTIPFGPFLVLGSLIMLFWGDQVISWYMRLSIQP